MHFAKCFTFEELNKTQKVAKRTIEGSIILGKFDGGIVQGGMSCRKLSSGEFYGGNSPGGIIQEELSEGQIKKSKCPEGSLIGGNCKEVSCSGEHYSEMFVQDKRPRALVPGGISKGAVVWEIVVQGELFRQNIGGSKIQGTIALRVKITVHNKE